MGAWNAERTQNRIDARDGAPDDPYAMVDPRGAYARARRRRAALPTLALAVVALLGAVGWLAYDELRPPDIGAYADQAITLRGLGGEDVTVSVAELAELECVDLAAESDGRGAQGESKAGRVEAYGPTLETLLAQYGAEPTDFSRIVVSCLDGYDVALHGDALEGQIVISIAQGKDALDERHWPARLVMPAESSGTWCYGVELIELHPADDGAEGEVPAGAEDGAVEGASPGDGDGEEGGGASKGAFSYDGEGAAEAAGKEGEL